MAHDLTNNSIMVEVWFTLLSIIPTEKLKLVVFLPSISIPMFCQSIRLFHQTNIFGDTGSPLFSIQRSICRFLVTVSYPFDFSF